MEQPHLFYSIFVEVISLIYKQENIDFVDVYRWVLNTEYSVFTLSIYYSLQLCKNGTNLVFLQNSQLIKI